MSYKLTAKDVKAKVAEEGVEYFCCYYTSPDDVDNSRIADAMREVTKAISNFQKVVDEECKG
jgi:hypothetical protein